MSDEYEYPLTEHQKLLFHRLTPLNQKFALAIIKGKSRIAAYIDAQGREADYAIMNTGASRIFNHPHVLAFIKSVRETIVSESIMDRKEALERLTRTARAGIHEIADLDDVEIIVDEEGRPMIRGSWTIRDRDPEKISMMQEILSSKDAHKIKMQAIQQLAKMEGWDAPEKKELTGKDGDPLMPAQPVDSELIKALVDKLID